MDKREAIKQRLKERTTSKRFKLPEGDTTFRVLPNAKGLDKFAFVEYAMHSNVGARKAYLRCGDKKAGEGNCWLCTKVAELGESKKSAAREAADKMKRKEACAVQIAYVSDGKWIGPVLWEMPVSIANKLMGIMSRKEVENPEKGYNITISRVGTGMTDTRYGDMDRDDEPSAAPAKVLAALQPFGEVVRKYDEALQKKEFFGHEQTEDITEEEPAEEEEVKPTSKKKPAVVEEEEEEVQVAKKPAAKKKPVVEEEETTEADEDGSAEDDLFGDGDIPNLDDETEGEESGQEEEEETPKPSKKPSGKPSKKVEPEPEEEEEPVAVSKKPAAKPKAKPTPPTDDDGF
jgi:hypothetical protein